MSARPSFSASASPSRRGGRLASEGGLLALALILAVLAWVVVWRSIWGPIVKVEVRLDLRCSKAFAVYADGPATLELAGPQGEVESAREALGAPPTLVVAVPDLLPTESNHDFPITDEMAAFPFPKRLERELKAGYAHEYRLTEEQVSFLEPGILKVEGAARGLPEGVEAEIAVTPLTATVRCPKGIVGATIRPDPVNVDGFFPRGAADLVPPPQTVRITFETWRNEAPYAELRRRVELPVVQATLTFHVVAQDDLTGRLVYEGAEGYDVSVSNENPEVEEGRWKQRFEGWKQDLDELKLQDKSWWFVVRIPPGKLPTGDAPVPLNVPVEFVMVWRERPLHVRPLGSPILTVTLKVKE